MTLQEATENGVYYWEFFVLIDGQQILAAGRPEAHIQHFASTDTLHIGKLSAPAGLEAVDKGSNWCRFELGDGHLMVWPSEASNEG